ncbi:MAG: hypothetical protein SGARI_004426 [Bacillariaceae sp.]
MSISHGEDDDESADTPKTLSLDDDSSSQSSSGNKSLCSRPDMPISHILTIYFVEAMAFQFRMESRTRQCVSNMLSPSKWDLKRKRKYSGEFKRDEDDMLDLQHDRSIDSDLSGEDQELTMSRNHMV